MRSLQLEVGMTDVLVDTKKPMNTRPIVAKKSAWLLPVHRDSKADNVCGFTFLPRSSHSCTLGLEANGPALLV